MPFEVTLIWKLSPTNITFKLKLSLLMADHMFLMPACHILLLHTYLTLKLFLSTCSSCEWVVSSLYMLNVFLHSIHLGFHFMGHLIPIVPTLNVLLDVKFNYIYKFVVTMYILCKKWLSKKTTFCSHYKCGYKSMGTKHKEIWTTNLLP